MPSNEPKTRARRTFGTERWISVRPATSSAALAMPTTARSPMANHPTGTMPMTATGSPHTARARVNAGPNRLPTIHSVAPAAPISPPAPIAEFSHPTPPSPNPSSSTDAATRSTVRSPRTNVWAANSATTRPAVECFRSARKPPASSRSVPSRAPRMMRCGAERDRQRRRRKQGDRRDGEGNLQAAEAERQRRDGGPDEHPERLPAAHHGVARHELLRRASQPGKERERRGALHDREQTLDHRGDEDERRRQAEKKDRGRREDDERPDGVDAGEDGRASGSDRRASWRAALR